MAVRTSHGLLSLVKPRLSPPRGGAFPFSNGQAPASSADERRCQRQEKRESQQQRRAGNDCLRRQLSEGPNQHDRLRWMTLDLYGDSTLDLCELAHAGE